MIKGARVCICPMLFVNCRIMSPESLARSCRIVKKQDLTPEAPHARTTTAR